MRFIKSDGNYFELKTRSYAQDIKINYSLNQLSNGSYHSIDRGVATDQYNCELRFSGIQEDINSMLNEFKALRSNNLDVEMSNFEVDFFGHHIDHTFITAVITGISTEESKQFKIYDVLVSFRLSGVSYKPANGFDIHTAFKCLQSGFTNNTDWNTHVVTTYNQSNYFVDRVQDSAQFVGTYLLSNDMIKEFYLFWKDQRGTAFNIADSDFGTTFMFGAESGNGIHKVVIEEVNYEPISALSSELTIKLLLST